MGGRTPFHAPRSAGVPPAGWPGVRPGDRTGGDKGAVPSILFKVEFISNYALPRNRNADDIASSAGALVGLHVDALVFPERKLAGGWHWGGGGGNMIPAHKFNFVWKLALFSYAATKARTSWRSCR